MDSIKDIISRLDERKDTMNNQKDTRKTDLNTNGQPDVSDVKSLTHRPAYEFANKKTEKLVTALYMVSDCMDSDDALKGKLRLLGVELLSDMYKLASLSPMDKHVHITLSLTHIYEILSFIEIAYTIGFISEMNTNILKKEFSILVSDLKSSQAKDKHFTFTLDDKMFDVPELAEVSNDSVRQDLKQESFIKDNADKRTTFNSMSFINNKSHLQNIQPKKTTSYVTNVADRQDRSNKILALIKDLPIGQAGKKEVSIKDIAVAFSDCSEKTIQREINALVSKGQIKKTGAKRWSRYAVI